LNRAIEQYVDGFAIERFYRVAKPAPIQFEFFRRYANMDADEILMMSLSFKQTTKRFKPHASVEINKK
jgi:hypothetical protein